MPKNTKKTGPIPFDPPRPTDTDELIVEGLRQNNLKNITVRLPHNAITVVCGPSGSGKSSLAFDTLFAEGRWRFIESLSTYTRLFLERMDRPVLETIRNVRPAIAIEQKNPVRTSRSTVGTATELNDYLRLLYARVGRLHCPECAAEVTPTEPATAAVTLLKDHPGVRAVIGFTTTHTQGPGFDKDPGQIGPASTERLLRELVKKGYVRILANADNTSDETINIGNSNDLSGIARDLYAPKKGPGNKEEQATNVDVNVVVDRIELKKEARQRLAEALETAFAEGSGSAWVWLPERGRIEFSRRLECTDCKLELEKPFPLLFSFNHPVGACTECKGFGNILKYDIDKIVPDKELTLAQGAIEPWTKPSYRWWYEELEAHEGGETLDLNKKFSELTEGEREILFKGTGDFEGIDGFFEHLETKKYKLHIRVFLSRYKGQFRCPECSGTRLKKKALSIRVSGVNIAELCSKTIAEAREFFINLKLSPFDEKLAREALRQITQKLEFLCQTGLGYITLARQTRTLSGGEAQRVTLTNQLASALSGVLYILDEPSIGLHPRDIDMLTQQLKKLSARANTVVVVEHDPSIIRASDHIVELGPGSGELGGRLVYSGPTGEFLAPANSQAGDQTLTSRYLTDSEAIPVPRWRRKGNGDEIVLKGAIGNNLKGMDLTIPLKTITCVTGVSGSGKSTLVMDTLYRALALRFNVRSEKPMPYASLEGAGSIRGVKLIDQQPIGKTPRSNPITYIGGFDDIRKFFASLKGSLGAGLGAGCFSFNVSGGRCESCKGEGVEKLEMYFLPDVYIQCAGCGGKRYKPQVLDVKHKGKNIHDVLEMTFDRACEFFGPLYGSGSGPGPGLEHKFAILKEVGLGYLKLGQSATTLSGGEAQRLKIARELASTGIAGSMVGARSGGNGRGSGGRGRGPENEADPGGYLYVLDEPTTGLHPDDIKKLLSVLGRLVDNGNTALVVEHNLDLIKTADHIIDLGPEGGDEGGRIVTQGDPEKVARARGSHTGRHLKGLLVDA